MKGAADRFGPKLTPINLHAVTPWYYVIQYREHIEMGTMALKDQLRIMQQERDRYLAYIQDEAEYSPYTGTKANAKHALDLATPLKRITPMKK